jgi:uncharacterized membrane protein YqjE
MNISPPPGLMDSVKRMMRTLLDIMQTRLELLVYELEEERLRLGQMLLLGSVALFCFGLSILLCTVLIVVLCWDSHRELVLASLSMLFFITGIFVAYKLRDMARTRPRLFTSSLAELTHDLEQLDAPP